MAGREAHPTSLAKLVHVLAFRPPAVGHRPVFGPLCPGRMAGIGGVRLDAVHGDWLAAASARFSPSPDRSGSPARRRGRDGICTAMALAVAMVVGHANAASTAFGDGKRRCW